MATCSCSPQQWPTQVYGMDNWAIATGRQLTKATVCQGGGKLSMAGCAWTRESPKTIPSTPLCLPFLPSRGSKTATFNPKFPVITLTVCGSQRFMLLPPFSNGFTRSGQSQANLTTGYQPQKRCCPACRETNEEEMDFIAKKGLEWGCHLD